MPIFEYKGLTRDGKNTKGTIDAENQRAARTRLKKDGIFVVDIKDKKKADLIAARNEADQLIYAAEKSLKEAGDKISAGDKEKIESAKKKLQDALSGSDLEAIKTAKDELMTASHKMAEELYKSAQSQAGAAGQSQTSSGPKHGSSGQGKGDGAVDADFEVVDDDKK